MTYTGVSSVSWNCITSSPFLCWSSCCSRSPATASTGLGLAQQLTPRVVAGGPLPEGLDGLARLAVGGAWHLHVDRDQGIAHPGVRAPGSLAPDPGRESPRR